MRYGICTGLDKLELLESAGVDYIEPAVTAVLEMEEKERELYREKLKLSRVKCEVFNVLFPGTMRLLDGSTDEAALREYLHGALAVVKSFGASVVVFGSGRSRRCPGNMTYGEAWGKLVEVYRIAGEVAAEYGITIVIEPLSYTETNLINTMAEGAILEADVAHPNVKLLADFFHVMANHDSIASMEVIRNFSHIHIASGNGRRYPLSEEGEEYAAFFRALKTIGYDGRISIEGGTDDMAADAPRALAFLKELQKS